MATKKNTPGWRDVKIRLADFDRPDLIGYRAMGYRINAKGPSE